MERISGVMVSTLTSSAVDGGFEHRSGQTKDCLQKREHYLKSVESQILFCKIKTTLILPKCSLKLISLGRHDFHMFQQAVGIRI
jgi:hypothetical protein